jgi:hypothetical protein
MLPVSVAAASTSAPSRIGAPTTMSQQGSGVPNIARLRSSGSGQLNSTTMKQAAKTQATTVKEQYARSRSRRVLPMKHLSALENGKRKRGRNRGHSAASKRRQRGKVSSLLRLDRSSPGRRGLIAAQSYEEFISSRERCKAPVAIFAK